MHLYLAIAYDVDHWVSIAFNELMKKSILKVTKNDEKLLGRAAYRLLVRTHAQVDEHWTNLAFKAPVVQHGPNCSGIYTQKECVRFWEDAWFGRKATPGMVTALLDTRLPGAAVYAVLDQFYVSGMSDGCRRRTLDSLKSKLGSAGVPPFSGGGGSGSYDGGSRYGRGGGGGVRH
jgi:hypothetical protein